MLDASLMIMMPVGDDSLGNNRIFFLQGLFEKSYPRWFPLSGVNEKAFLSCANKVCI
jgi:hypothetical protein